MLKVAVIIRHKSYEREPPLEVWVTDTLRRGFGENMSCFTDEEAYAFARRHDVPVIDMQGVGRIHSVEQLQKEMLRYLEITPNGVIMVLRPDPDK